MLKVKQVKVIITGYKYYVFLRRLFLTLVIIASTVGLISTILLNNNFIKNFTIGEKLNPVNNNTPAVPANSSPNTSFRTDISRDLLTTQPNIVVTYPTIEHNKKKESLITKQISRPVYLPLNMKSGQFVTFTVKVDRIKKFVFQFLPSQITGIINQQHQKITGFFIYYNSLSTNKLVKFYASTGSNKEFYETNWGSQEPIIPFSKQNYINLDFSIDFGSNTGKWILLTHYKYMYINQVGKITTDQLQMVSGKNHKTINVSTLVEHVPKLQFAHDSTDHTLKDYDKYAGLITEANFSGAAESFSMHPKFYQYLDDGFTKNPWPYWNFAFEIMHNSGKKDMMYLDLQFNDVNPKRKYQLRITKDSGIWHWNDYSNYFFCYLVPKIKRVNLQSFTK